MTTQAQSVKLQQAAVPMISRRGPGGSAFGGRGGADGCLHARVFYSWWFHEVSIRPSQFWGTLKSMGHAVRYAVEARRAQ